MFFSYNKNRKHNLFVVNVIIFYHYIYIYNKKHRSYQTNTHTRVQFFT